MIQRAESEFKRRRRLAGGRCKRSGVRSRDSFPKISGGARWLPESDHAAAVGMRARARVRARIRAEKKQGDGDGDSLFKDSEDRSVEKLEADRNDACTECQSERHDCNSENDLICIRECGARAPVPSELFPVHKS